VRGRHAGYVLPWVCEKETCWLYTTLGM